MKDENPFLSMHVPELKPFKVVMHGDETIVLHINAVSASVLIDKIKNRRIATPHNMTGFKVEAV